MMILNILDNNIDDDEGIKLLLESLKQNNSIIKLNLTGNFMI